MQNKKYVCYAFSLFGIKLKKDKCIMSSDFIVSCFTIWHLGNESTNTYYSVKLIEYIDCISYIKEYKLILYYRFVSKTKQLSFYEKRFTIVEGHTHSCFRYLLSSSLKISNIFSSQWQSLTSRVINLLNDNIFAIPHFLHRKQSMLLTTKRNENFW